MRPDRIMTARDNSAVIFSQDMSSLFRFRKSCFLLQDVWGSSHRKLPTKSNQFFNLLNHAIGNGTYRIQSRVQEGSRRHARALIAQKIFCRIY